MSWAISTTRKNLEVDIALIDMKSFYDSVDYKVFGKSNVGCSYNLPFDIKTRKFNTT